MNTVSFTGHLGNAPRTRQLVSGTPVCDFDIAVNRRFTQNGQVVEQTTWVNVTAWRGLAQTCAQYLEKGRHVLVTGRLETPDAYLDKDGKPRARNRITAMSVEFLGSNSAGANTATTPEMDAALQAASQPLTEAEILASAVEF